MKLAFAFAVLLATSLCVSAKPMTFKNSGLKIETVITLDVQGSAPPALSRVQNMVRTP